MNVGLSRSVIDATINGWLQAFGFLMTLYAYGHGSFLGWFLALTTLYCSYRDAINKSLPNPYVPVFKGMKVTSNIVLEKISQAPWFNTAMEKYAPYAEPPLVAIFKAVHFLRLTEIPIPQAVANTWTTVMTETNTTYLVQGLVTAYRQTVSKVVGQPPLDPVKED